MDLWKACEKIETRRTGASVVLRGILYPEYVETGLVAAPEKEDGLFRVWLTANEVARLPMGHPAFPAELAAVVALAQSGASIAAVRAHLTRDQGPWHVGPTYKMRD